MAAVKGQELPMNILHVCGRWRLGGIRTIVNSIIELNQEGMSCHDLLLTLEPSSVQGPSNCKTYALDFWSRNLLSCFHETRDICRKYDAVMIHGAHPIVVLALVTLNRPCMIFQHGMSVSNGSLAKRSLKKIWFSVIPTILNARVICSSEYALQKVKILGIRVPRKRLVVIPFGVALRNTANTPKRKFGSGRLNVGIAGRFVGKKRFHLVLKSLRSYRDGVPILLRIAGEGPEQEYLQSLATEIVNDQVKVDFMGNVANMDTFYESLDLFIFPSKGESFGLVALEALCRGVPVAVFSDVGAPLMFVENYRNGFVLEKGVEGLRKLWTSLIHRPDLLQQLGQRISTEDLSCFNIAKTRGALEWLIGDKSNFSRGLLENS